MEIEQLNWDLYDLGDPGSPQWLITLFCECCHENLSVANCHHCHRALCHACIAKVLSPEEFPEDTRDRVEEAVWCYQCAREFSDGDLIEEAGCLFFSAYCSRSSV